MSGAPKKPPMIPWSPRRFIVILVGLFVLNWLIVAVFAPPEKRIKVPYSPTFLQEVRKGNVKEISSTGDTVKGEFKKEVKYKGDTRQGLRDRDPDVRERPRAVAAARGQRRGDQRRRRQASARCFRPSCSASARRSCWWRCSSSCSAAPPRARAGAACSGSSAAAARDGSSPRRRRSPSRTWPGSRRPSRSCWRSSTS